MALATFGVQKLRGKSTKRSFRDAMLIGGMGQIGGMAGVGGITPFGSATTAGSIQGLGQTSVGQGLRGLFPQFASQAATAPAAAIPAGVGTVAANSPFAAAGSSALSGTGAAAATKGTVAKTGIMETLKGLLPTSDAGRIAAASMALPLLAGDDGPNKMYLPVPNQAYTKFANSGHGGTPTGFMTRDYATGINSPLVQPGEYITPEEVLGDEPTQTFKAVEMNTGGLASIAKFNEGGMGQVLPSKMTHDENDSNNYDRANGFVLDGTGHGKDHEDTMLAQLADGEFVSRSHAVLGAGIIAGANPSDKSDQRKKGAKFFYDQQKQLKRIFDLINANKNRADSVH
jgi:hypothetical protein